MSHPFSKVLRENPMALRVKDGRPMHLFGADELDRLDTELERAREDIAELVGVLHDFREHVIRYAEVWDMEGGSHHHPIWQQVAAALAKHARAETSGNADKQAKFLKAAGVPIEDEPHGD